MPTILPREHLLSALCRGINQGIASNWRELLPEPGSDGAELSPGHILRPVYASIAFQYQGITCQQLLTDHTLWRYYRSFLPNPLEYSPNYDDWPSFYNHDRVLHPMRLVRYRQAKQWRWCLACNQEDYNDHGTCYWHIEHQLAGLSHCPKHPKSLLRGACLSCGSQINDISDKSVHLSPENRCPLCLNNFELNETVPQHPVIEWITMVSNQLLSGSKFDAERVRRDIFHEIGIDPTTKPTSTHRKRVSIARKMINSALPLEVTNWLFQTQKRGFYRAGEPVTPLCLRQLYSSDAVIHPLSWLVIVWIVFSGDRKLANYLTPWEKI